ncbi:amino acid/amide ABC transporter membrane protein 2, HAAT family (TC 3.A.1.4.-) [Mesorhizobium albiziae]|uniref:Amino acid/amide ABC transporter membrane protein 2, HAAT family (TC 3.A.1.4.-) n=1 Tax=Neomesorhizobium albiziae TaxID=335020 RepID=A0A1I4A4M0_9HYPH|nr:branched-chain amino acid ABC transporter permease [Mesorhizobium albiziae]GLS34039.1 branched-chain amino acid ABC transporter permease [Mesorhizobium albiziae]SFK51268.1 amino acid/amide ABC transporter membrane protein 2, HAAT family (TC 3.A.1.4.-) [Mesorhizobium albiziae]
MRTVFKTSYDADINLFRDSVQAAWYLALLALALVLPLLLDVFMLGEVTNMLIWAVAGMGLMILVGQSGQASLGHAAFLAIGCYANVLLQERLGLPFIVSFPLAGLIAGFAGVLLAIPTARLHGIYLAIATLAIAILTDDVIVLAEPLTGGVTGLVTPTINIFGLEIDRYVTPDRFYWLVLAVVVLTVLAYRNLLRAPLGRAFAAVRDSEVSAQAMGVNVPRTKATAFGISTAITGLAGALMGHFAGVFNNETFSIIISIQLLLMIVIGGLGSIHGAFFGAIVVALLPQAIALSRDFVGGLFGTGSMAMPGLDSAVFGAILILFILFEPMGIYGRWVKIRTYFELFPFYRRDMFRRQKSYLKTERLR